MLKQQFRFHGHGSLKYLQKHGTGHRESFIMMRSVPNTRHQSYRVAVVVAKKVAKGAIERNRIRRRIYEIVRKLGPGIKSGNDIVIVVYSNDAARVPSPELQEIVERLLKKANLIQ